MFVLHGNLLKSITKTTLKGKQYKVHQVLANGGERYNVVQVKDWENREFKPGNVELPVWITSWATETGKHGIEVILQKEKG